MKTVIGKKHKVEWDKGFIFAPYIPIMGFTLPDVKLDGYDKDGKPKFKKTK